MSNQYGPWQGQPQGAPTPGDQWGAPQQGWGQASGWDAQQGYGSAPSWGTQQGHGSAPGWGNQQPGPGWHGQPPQKQGMSPAVLAAIAGVLVLVLVAGFMMLRNRDKDKAGDGGGTVTAQVTVGGPPTASERTIMGKEIPQEFDGWTFDPIGDKRTIESSSVLMFRRHGLIAGAVVSSIDGSMMIKTLSGDITVIHEGACGNISTMYVCILLAKDGYVQVSQATLSHDDTIHFADALSKALG